MANTRQSAKRAQQENKRAARNVIVRSTAKTALKKAVLAIQSKDAAKAKEAYEFAVKTVSKSASKGAIPKGRAARKISRLTLLLKKTVPGAIATK